MDENEIQEAPEIIDLDGEPFVAVGELDFEGETYVALTPYIEEDEESEESEEAEFVILKEVTENGELFLATVDDDELYDKIGEMFTEVFESEESEDY